MERMIATVELVRLKHQFKGYIHLKLLPGCQQAAVERALQLANRVSVNLEPPSAERLLRLSEHKRFDGELMQPMRRAHPGVFPVEVNRATPEAERRCVSRCRGLEASGHSCYESGSKRPVRRTPTSQAIAASLKVPGAGPPGTRRCHPAPRAQLPPDSR